MQRCCCCNALFDLNSKGCKVIEVVSRDKYLNKNGPMLLRVTHFCSPECFTVFTNLDGKTEASKNNFYVEV
jgi:hypothetical protein